MTEDDRAIAQDVAQWLKVVGQELSDLEKSLGGSAVGKAASAADLASAWLDLFTSGVVNGQHTEA